MTATTATTRPSDRLAASVAREVLMQLALPLGGGLLLRVQVRVVEVLDLCRYLHDRIAARDDLAAQEGVAIVVGRAVEERARTSASIRRARAAARCT